MSSESGEAAGEDWVLELRHRVFLSHSGAQKGFVEQLDVDLRRWDRYPFFDKDRNSLPVGERFPPLIFEAIRQCRVGVVILSDEFLSSRWPMLELVEMVETMEREPNQMTLMPIYLGISCDDLRCEKRLAVWRAKWCGFAQSDTRIKPVEWERAVKALRSINGLIFNEAKGEVKLREEIVGEICKIVPAYHVWDDSHVQGKMRLNKTICEKIEKTSASERYGAKVVGLYGIGGIGKTTACKCLCKHLHMKFDGRVCHVEFGNDTTEKDRVQEVLRRLGDITIEALKNLSTEECWIRLKEVMGLKVVFLAIDNVSESSFDEAKKYLKVGYGRGSTLMVTARALHDLKHVGIDGWDCLAMPELEQEAARALFLFHAEPKDEVDERVELQCVSRCHFYKGHNNSYHYHPLALKVLGSQLVAQDPEEWESQLNEADVFNQSQERENGVFSILRRSFDRLVDEDQLLFMDVALFDIANVKRMSMHRMQQVGGISMKTFDWLSMVHGLDVEVVKKRLNGLKRKALLEDLGDGSAPIGMHDLWREFAVMETKRSTMENRRWVYEVSKKGDVESILSGGGWKNLQRIHVVKEEMEYDKSKCEVSITNCSRVTVLRLLNASVENNTFDLRALRQLKSLELIPSRIGMSPIVSGLGLLTNLKVLVWMSIGAENVNAVKEISHLTKLQFLLLTCELTDVVMRLELGQLRWLREVVLKFGGELTISGLSSEMTELRILNLEGSRGLRRCSGVGDVVDLERLSLSGCARVEELPSLQQLTQLQSLKLKVSDCTSLKALPGLGSLGDLEMLNAGGCKYLGELPDLSSLTKLIFLDLEGCDLLKCIPGLGNLICLKTLKLGGCTRLEELPNLGRLTRLKLLDVSDCTSLKALPGLGSLGDLEMLNAGGCKYLGELPDLSSLTKLIFLDLEGCDLLKCIPGLGNLICLKTLKLGGCTRLEELPNLGRLTRLKLLDVSDCTSLKALPGLGSLGDLEMLNAGGCKYLGELPDLSSLTKLIFLDLEGCDLLKCIPGLGNLICLITLKLGGCTRLEELPNLGRLTRLKLLDVSDCTSLKALPGLGSLVLLRRVHSRGCKELDELPDVSSLTELIFLKLEGCDSLKCIPGLGILVRLKTLELMRCTRLEELPNLEQLTQLQGLDVSDCTSLKALPGLGSLVALLRVHGRGCKKLDELPDVSRLTKLIYLDLEGCDTLKCIPGLGNLVCLKVLKLRGCTRLEELPSLEQLTQLHLLDVSSCTSLKALPGLGRVVALVRLDAGGCKVLDELPDVSSLTKLKFLKMEGCDSLKCIPGLGNLVCLRRLKLRGCRRVEELPNLEQLTQLNLLDVSDCTSLKALPGLGSLVTLKVLDARGCKDLDELPDVSSLTKLKELGLGGCDSFKCIPGLSNLVYLKELKLRRCTTIKELPNLQLFTQLRTLVVSDCGFTSLSSSGPLTALEKLHLEGCRSLKELPAFDIFPGLSDLKISGCGVKLDKQDVDSLQARCRSFEVDGSCLVPHFLVNVELGVPATSEPMDQISVWRAVIWRILTIGVRFFLYFFR